MSTGMHEEGSVSGNMPNDAGKEPSSVGKPSSDKASGERPTIIQRLVSAIKSLLRFLGQTGTVSGGLKNIASRWSATIGGGYRNTAEGDYSTIGGGKENTASSWHSTIGGGEKNTASSWHSTIGGGYKNTASGESSTVGGGEKNTADGWYSTVGGGYKNTASGETSTVGGGGKNTAGGLSSTVSGGVKNNASGEGSTIGGGGENAASGKGSIVSGGLANTASGDFSVVVGGAYNTANGRYNLVFGQGVIPAVAEDYRVYFFGDGSLVPEEASGSDESKSEEPKANPSGFVVINRLQGSHPIHVGTNGKNGNGAYLSAGGVWTNASSRAKKDRFRLLDAEEVLGKIRALPVEGWYYKGTNEYHIGPYAEDFHEAFGTGLLDRPEEARGYLAASDVAGVALLGIQALAERDEAYERRIAALEAENAQLRSTVEVLRGEQADLEAENGELRAIVEALRAQQAALATELERLRTVVGLKAEGSVWK